MTAFYLAARFRAMMLVAFAAFVAVPARASEAAWAALRDGGTVMLIRHARAPGTGDPAVFRLDECATQRNLSPAGRDQARTLGQDVRSQRVTATAVRSSRWCRALDTARLAFPAASVEPDPALDSFVGSAGTRDAQTASARLIINDWRGRDGVLVLVTHQVNITALTGVFPEEGEIVVLRPKAGGGFDLLGSIKP